MAITERIVQNKRSSTGELTGKPGTVYDVNIKYKTNGAWKTYSKKGFPTKKEALQHEAAMKSKLSNPSYIPPTASQRKMTVAEHLETWIGRHGKVNLRPSTVTVKPTIALQPFKKRKALETLISKAFLFGLPSTN